MEDHLSMLRSLVLTHEDIGEGAGSGVREDKERETRDEKRERLELGTWSADAVDTMINL